MSQVVFLLHLNLDSFTHTQYKPNTQRWFFFLHQRKQDKPENLGYNSDSMVGVVVLMDSLLFSLFH